MYLLVFNGSNLLDTSQKLMSGSYRYYPVWPLVFLNIPRATVVASV